MSTVAVLQKMYERCDSGQSEGVTRLKTLNFMKGMGSLRRAKKEKVTSGSLIYISPNSNRGERIV